MVYSYSDLDQKNLKWFPNDTSRATLIFLDNKHLCKETFNRQLLLGLFLVDVLDNTTKRLLNLVVLALDNFLIILVRKHLADQKKLK